MRTTVLQDLERRISELGTPATRQGYRFFRQEYQNISDTLDMLQKDLDFTHRRLTEDEQYFNCLLDDPIIRWAYQAPETDLVAHRNELFARRLVNEELQERLAETATELEQRYHSGVHQYRRATFRRIGSAVAAFLAGALLSGVLLNYTHKPTTNMTPQEHSHTSQVSEMRFPEREGWITPEPLKKQVRNISFKIGDPLIVVDPELQQERLYHVELIEQARYPVSTGIVPGVRARRGDNRTPENGPDDYFIVTRPPERSVDWLWDGQRAYGPWFVRFDTPEHSLKKYSMRWPPESPFGLHGTNQPEKLGYRASHGCIRHNNAIISWLVNSGNLRAAKKGVDASKIIIKSGIFAGAE